MNKYEEALNSLIYIRRDENNKPIDIVANDFTTVKGKSTFQMRVEFIDTLQELVKRATPMKPIKGSFFGYQCPNCDEFTLECSFDNYGYCDTKLDYCPNCGQAIDWSDK